MEIFVKRLTLSYGKKGSAGEQYENIIARKEAADGPESKNHPQYPHIVCGV